MREIRDDIRANTSQILTRFEALTQRDPWIHLPRDYWLDMLSEVVPRLADAALGEPGDEEAVRLLLQAAVGHGEHRLRDGFPESLIFHEYYLLRAALWDHLCAGAHAPGQRQAAIMRIDVLVTLAVRGSTRGYHRAVFEAQGRWGEVVEDLVSEWVEMNRGRGG